MTFSKSKLIIFFSFKAIENTRLLKAYADIDPRVSQLGYMIKRLAKVRRREYLL